MKKSLWILLSCFVGTHTQKPKLKKYWKEHKHSIFAFLHDFSYPLKPITFVRWYTRLIIQKIQRIHSHLLYPTRQCRYASEGATMIVAKRSAHPSRTLSICIYTNPTVGTKNLDLTSQSCKRTLLPIHYLSVTHTAHNRRT